MASLCMADVRAGSIADCMQQLIEVLAEHGERFDFQVSIVPVDEGQYLVDITEDERIRAMRVARQMKKGHSIGDVRPDLPTVEEVLAGE